MKVLVLLGTNGHTLADYYNHWLVCTDSETLHELYIVYYLGPTACHIVIFAEVPSLIGG